MNITQMRSYFYDSFIAWEIVRVRLHVNKSDLWWGFSRLLAFPGFGSSLWHSSRGLLWIARSFNALWRIFCLSVFPHGPRLQQHTLLTQGPNVFSRCTSRHSSWWRQREPEDKRRGVYKYLKSRWEGSLSWAYIMVFNNKSIYYNFWRCTDCPFLSHICTNAGLKATNRSRFCVWSFYFAQDST